MLCLSVNDRRKIPVRRFDIFILFQYPVMSVYGFDLSITRTFASGKTEKMVMQWLVELGLCSGKVKFKTLIFAIYNDFFAMELFISFKNF